MSKHPTGRGSDQFVVRFPDGMRDQIKAHAAANNRSMNAEIISLLASALHEAEYSRMSAGMLPLRPVTDSDRGYMELMASHKRGEASPFPEPESSGDDIPEQARLLIEDVVKVLMQRGWTPPK